VAAWLPSVKASIAFFARKERGGEQTVGNNTFHFKQITQNTFPVFQYFNQQVNLNLPFFFSGFCFFFI
jgi:hypothetical protein